MHPQAAAAVLGGGLFICGGYDGRPLTIQRVAFGSAPLQSLLVACLIRRLSLLSHVLRQLCFPCCNAHCALVQVELSRGVATVNASLFFHDLVALLVLFLGRWGHVGGCNRIGLWRCNCYWHVVWLHRR